MMVNVGICVPDKLGDTETKFKRKAAKLNLEILERNGRKVYDSCQNTDNGARDVYGDGCYAYDEHDSDCGAYDDDDFKASKMCCVCGGGATQVDGKLKDTCVYKAIEDSECPSSTPADYLECNEEGLQHGDLCWVEYDDYPLIDGSVGEDEGTDCGDYVFKCVKECSKDQDCTTRFPYCIDGSCEECLTDQDCPTTRPFCTKNPGNSEGRCKGPYPITATKSNCSDYGLEPLMDKSICQQLSDDLFPDNGDISEDTEDYYPLGCHLYEGVEVMFNDGSEGGGRYYDRMGVCIAEPIDCEWSEYSKWSKCKNGKEERTRAVETRALFGGKSCKGQEKQTRTCGEEESCWNLRSKRQCRAIKMKGLCGTAFWMKQCCATCGAGCANIWPNKKCRKLVPHCRRSSKVRRKCQKACGKC